MTYRIPFNRSTPVGNELAYIAQALDSGVTAGDGAFTARCEALLQERMGARVLLTTSATAALEMAALLCDVGPGDEVVLPSYTFVSTANAFGLRGARLRFVDIREDTLNLDESRLEEAIGPRTKVIVPVHYAGVACAMDVITALARRNGIRVVEDAAQAIGATWHGAALGTLGDLGVFSFHESKNLTCGEGGALIIGDAALAERAEVIREKGTDRKKFFRGEVDKYTWIDVGSSHVLSDLLAAFLLAQLEHLDRITRARLRLHRRYHVALAPLEQRGLLRRPVVPDGCGSNAHLFHVLLPDIETRTRLIDHLREAGINAVFHYVPLHLSPMGRRMGYQPGDLPVTERAADRVLRLPLHPGLSDEDVDDVVSAICAFFGAAAPEPEVVIERVAQPDPTRA